MNRYTTGATKAQTDAAIEKYRAAKGGYGGLNVLRIAPLLVPADHRIAGPDILAALRRMYADANAITESENAAYDDMVLVGKWLRGE